MSAEPWFEVAFRADYLDLYAHRDQASARAEVEGLQRQGLTGKVLDLCCGQGRHLVAMREAGLEAYGLDLSRELLVRASHLDGGEVAEGRLAQADQRSLPLGSAQFDVVTLLFSSFGYHDEAGDLRVLNEGARVLRPGGLLVLDLMNPTRIRSTLVPESRREQGELVLEERRELSPGGDRVRKHVTFKRGEQVRSWTEDVRLYEPHELDTLLDAAGFSTAQRLGGFAGAPYGPDAERQIVLARLEG